MTDASAAEEAAADGEEVELDEEYADGEEAGEEVVLEDPEEQEPGPPRRLEPAPKRGAAAPPRREPAVAAAAPLTSHELFAARKRSETSIRDTTCMAICRIKHGLRQPGAQEDGRPFVPEDWDSAFKPTLGSYVKFLLSRPDQFRVVEGAAQGLYTVKNVATSRLTTAPSWEELARAKGKAKGKGKGKPKGKEKGEPKGKEKGKGKAKGKGKGKAQDGDHVAPPAAGVAWDSLAARKSAGPGASTAARGAAPEKPRAGAPRAVVKAEAEVPPARAGARASGALAAAAKEELQEAEAAAADPGLFGEAELAEDEWEEEAMGEEGAAEAEPEPMAKLGAHGSLISSLLSGGLLGDALSRKRGAPAGPGASKRAR